MIEDTLETLSVLHGQEDSWYRKENWLPKIEKRRSCDAFVDGNCRKKMAMWCFQVGDILDFRKDTIEISISYVDRFLSTTAGKLARSSPEVFQLVCMTCLYTAAKIHESRAISAEAMASISKGLASPKHIIRMESIILFHLKWKMHPPTTSTFIHLMLDLIPISILNEENREFVRTLSMLQAKIAICNDSLFQVNPSVVAYASLMNSIEVQNVLQDEVLGDVGYVLAECIGIDCNAQNIIAMQKDLYESALHPSRDFTKHERLNSPRTPSPVSTIEEESNTIRMKPRKTNYYRRTPNPRRLRCETPANLKLCAF